jgi:pyruvate formate lyase activating enzyme
MPTTTVLQVEDYLEGNRKWIDGVVITGGEPTTHSDLPSLCQKLKKLRFNVKVDTNGTNPAMIRKLVEGRLIDYVALDVKAPLTEQEYSRVTGIKAALLIGRIKDTILFLLENHVDYEFRTTLVPTLHKPESVDRICQAIKGCRKYVLQNFKSEVDTIDPMFKTLQPFSAAQMEAFLQTAKKTVPDTRLRI